MSENLIKAERIEIYNLAVEITRKCQLKCAHCLKGDAQNVDMSPEIIDKLLESVCSIGRLLFTGGEPTMNLDGMRYFLDALKKRDITLNKLVIITNGCDISEEVFNLIKEYYAYITYRKGYGKHKIEISVSSDVYHKQSGSEPEKAYNAYKKEFANYPLVKVNDYPFGNEPKAVGRGKQLKEAIYLPQYLPRKKIEVMTAGSRHYCLARKYYKLKDGVSAYIICPVFLTVYGDILHFESSGEETLHLDTIGVNIAMGGLMGAIWQYNQNAEDCITCAIVKEAVSPGTLQFFSERKEIDNHDKHKGKFDDVANDGVEHKVSDDEMTAIVKEWFNEFGESAISNASQIISEIQMKTNKVYHNQIDRIMSQINTVQKPIDPTYYKKVETFRKDEERKVREKHPEWTHGDCIKYANSQKWVEYFSKRYSISDRILLKHHLEILDNICSKYE